MSSYCRVHSLLYAPVECELAIIRSHLNVGEFLKRNPHAVTAKQILPSDHSSLLDFDLKAPINYLTLPCRIRPVATGAQWSGPIKSRILYEFMPGRATESATGSATYSEGLSADRLSLLLDRGLTVKVYQLID